MPDALDIFSPLIGGGRKNCKEPPGLLFVSVISIKPLRTMEQGKIMFAPGGKEKNVFSAKIL